MGRIPLTFASIFMEVEVLLHPLLWIYVSYTSCISLRDALGCN